MIRAKDSGLVREGESVLTYKIPELHYFPNDQKMMILGQGSIVGDEDIINRPDYSSTLRCLS